MSAAYEAEGCTDQGEWAIWDGEFKNGPTPKASGDGIEALRNALADNKPEWAVYQLSAKYLVRLKWRPEGANPMAKNKANQHESYFLEMHPDSKVTVEVLGKVNLTPQELFECVRPGSGTKVIQDPF